MKLGKEQLWERQGGGGERGGWEREDLGKTVNIENTFSQQLGRGKMFGN